MRRGVLTTALFMDNSPSAILQIMKQIWEGLQDEASDWFLCRSAPEAVPAPAATPAETAAVPSVVRVFFPERGQAYSHYNDRLTRTTAIWLTSSGKLARQRDRWSQGLQFSHPVGRLPACDRRCRHGRARHVLLTLGAHPRHAGAERAAVPTGTRLASAAAGQTGICVGQWPPACVCARAAVHSRPASPKKATHISWKKKKKKIYLSVGRHGRPRHRERHRAV